MLSYRSFFLLWQWRQWLYHYKCFPSGPSFSTEWHIAVAISLNSTSYTCSYPVTTTTIASNFALVRRTVFCTTTISECLENTRESGHQQYHQETRASTAATILTAFSLCQKTTSWPPTFCKVAEAQKASEHRQRRVLCNFTSYS